MPLYDGPLVAIEPSEEFPGGFEVTLKQSRLRFNVGRQSAGDLLDGLSRLLSGDAPAAPMPDLPSLTCAACGSQIGPRPHPGGIVLRCPRCRALGFWPKLGR